MSEKQTHLGKIEVPSSVSHLQLTRERKKKPVNDFLNRKDIDHDLGGVVGWKAAFGARYKGQLIAVCILSRPSAREIDHNSIIELNRFASHPNRPDNTGSWLIARCIRWANLEGYDKMVSYSGISGNEGTLYKALKFNKVSTQSVSGDGWKSRDGRKENPSYDRVKWEKELDGINRQ